MANSYNLKKLQDIGYVKYHSMNGQIKYKKQIGDSEYIILNKNGKIYKYVCDYRKTVEIPLLNEEIEILKEK